LDKIKTNNNKFEINENKNIESVNENHNFLHDNNKGNKVILNNQIKNIPKLNLNNENKNQNNNLISFDNFSNILYGSKYINRQTLPNSLKEIKTKLEKKFGSQPIYLKEEEYYKYIEQIKREQDQLINVDDPEMKELYDILAGNEEYVFKSKLIEIIKIFELPIDYNKFFEPVKDIEKLTFEDFCCLFKPGSEINDIVIHTFYSTFIGKDSDNNNDAAIKAANFPIKYVPY
jgi:hypothetical protein